MGSRWKMPKGYDGRPFVLRNLETRLQKQGLFEKYPQYQDLPYMVDLFQRDNIKNDESVRLFLYHAYGKVFTHFSGKDIRDQLIVDFLPHDATKMTSRFRYGVNFGPYCFAAANRTTDTLAYFLHEIGHGMFPCEDPLEAEVAASFVQQLFWQKLQTEIKPISYFSLENGRDKSSIFDSAKQLLKQGAVPSEVFSQGFSERTFAALPKELDAKTLCTMLAHTAHARP